MANVSIGKIFTPSNLCEYYVGRTNGLNYYLNSIRSYNVMTPEEEIKCILEYKKTHDLSKRNLLVSCNQRFVYALAKRLSTDSDTIIDLVNEGNIGLIEAIDKYDISYADKNRNTLMMFASNYVIKNMLNFFTMNKIVSRKADMKYGSKVANERNAFFAKNGRFPTDDEMRDIFLEKYGLNFKDNCAVEQSIIVSIDDAMSLNGDAVIIANSDEFNKRTCSENDWINIESEDEYKYKTNNLLNRLSERDRDIMMKLFGLNGKEYTPEQIADMYGLTKTRVMQIKRKSLAKMRA